MATSAGPKQAVAFVDGQNLYHRAKELFGYRDPNYDVVKLATEICAVKACTLKEVRFYTGIPDVADNPRWNAFWGSKLQAMSRQGVVVYSRSLRYRWQEVRLPAGGTHRYRSADEKGIDVRIAVELIRLAYEQEYDVAIIFSQDQDLREATEAVKAIAKEQGRWVDLVCAYPFDPANAQGGKARGINGTDWQRVDRTTYDRCLDPYNHHRPPGGGR